MRFNYAIDPRTVDKVIEIANGTLQATINPEALQKGISCRQNVETMANSNKAVYDINTGFGPLCDVHLTPEETRKLRVNLLITHAVCVGNPISKELSKIMMRTLSV